MSDARITMVGIGASAGGVEAFHSFFTALPDDTGHAFIVVLHLAPDRKSLLPEILARWTKMPVISAAHDMQPQANHVYVVPPGFLATMSGGRLCLRPTLPEERHEVAPIDIFFNSIAAEAKERAVGIVLSGTGHDGALGLKAIREAGGLTIAQGTNGSAPQYAGMPESAIATGAVDIVALVQDIPVRMMAAQATASFLPDGALNKGEMEAARLAICRILLDRVGHDFSQYKDKTFLRRVRRRMQMLSLVDLSAYVAVLHGDRHEAMVLFRDLLIGVTSFFRDPETFQVLQRAVIPLLFEGKGPNDSVRAWVAGCSTGEEAYSIAILLQEFADTLAAPPRLQVFATDIDSAAIAAARAGRYPALLLRDMAPARLERFFVPHENSYAVSKEIRAFCIFSIHSLLRDPPFSRVDFLSCRNLLIYLDNDAQARVIPTFHYALSKGGIMLLGSSESVSRHEDVFATIDKKHRVFLRRDVPSTLPQLPFRTVEMEPQSKKDGKSVVPAGDSWVHAVSRARTRVLESYAAPFVVVTVDGDVVHYSSHTGEFLEPAHGAPSRNIFEMARPAIRPGLRSALRRAVETGFRVEQRLIVTGETRAMTMVIEPINGPPERAFLIIFNQDPYISPSTAAVADDSSVVAALERENRDLREELQSISEEHETALEELRSSNEEMHSVNEELQSSNEELETSREEIQSINEEMSTVNTQLSAKLEELDRANGDLRNLFESTRVATIFLDAHLVIRGFTPEVAKIYNLIPSDVGRPLTDIVSRVNYDQLQDDVRRVLETLEPRERRLARADGAAHYLMRLLPYRTPDSSVDGLLITFIEINSVVEAEQHQLVLIDELNHRVKNMLTAVISIASQTLRRSTALPEFAGVFLGRLHALDVCYELLSTGGWVGVALPDLLAAELRRLVPATGDRIGIAGPDISLSAAHALAIGLAIHELCTNAIKFGALSKPDGVVAIGWSTAAAPDGESLVIDWREQGGPQIQPPDGNGVGLSLIEWALTQSVTGHAKISFPPDGLHAKITIFLGPNPQRSV